jgi:catechol 2,3-dioxygenase-like lactoylglutathione lyase family enzyme
VLESADPVAFVPSGDLNRSRAYFQDVLGLELVSTSAFACVFRVGSMTLRVTKVDELRPQPFTVFGWLVDDIRSVVGALRTADVDVISYDGLGQDDLGVWTTPTGDLVAWFHDPDGNVLSLTQLARDRT